MIRNSRKHDQLNLLLLSLYYAKACNELEGDISASLLPARLDFFEKESNLAFAFLDVLAENFLPSSSPTSTGNPHSEAVNI